MKAYQDGIAKFKAQGAEVFGVSTDNLPSLRHWSDEVLKLDVPLLSDFMRTTATAYGILIADRGIANRSTFVVDTEGKIQFIEEGGSAIDPTSALDACTRVKR